MAQQIFFELSIVIAIATLVSIIMKLIRQPLIIGHIITGIILGPFVLNFVQSTDTLIAFSEIGIAFLLFIVGLNLNVRTLKEIGSVALMTGIGQVIFTFIIGYAICIMMGFSTIASLYISIALTFSSTIIIVKLLSDKNDLETLYGRIAIGFLLVQDFIAVVILMLLSSPFNGQTIAAALVYTIIKIVLIALAVLFLGNFVLPKVLHYMAKSQELLFLFGIAWAFALAVIMERIGFSIEIGALFAGISLASSPFHLGISSKLRPLRDFFIVLFFVLLGTQMNVSIGQGMIWAIPIFSLFILVGNPLIVMAIMGALGYRKRTSFQAGLTVAQISEFSLILVVLGMKLGHLSPEIVSIVTIVGIITMAGSTYMIMYSDKLYGFLSRYLGIFERKITKGEPSPAIGNFDIILFGYNRIGYSMVQSFKKLKKRFLIVDYNPDIIQMAVNNGLPYKFGDVSDSELIEELNLQNAKLVISTIPQLDINLFLIEKTKSKNKKTIIVMTSHQIDDAFKLYEAGADYVIMPHFLGGEHASALIENFGTNLGRFVKEKVKHIGELNQRRIFGHEHPQHHK